MGNQLNDIYSLCTIACNFQGKVKLTKRPQSWRFKLEIRPYRCIPIMSWMDSECIQLWYLELCLFGQFDAFSQEELVKPCFCNNFQEQSNKWWSIQALDYQSIVQRSGIKNVRIEENSIFSIVQYCMLDDFCLAQTGLYAKFLENSGNFISLHLEELSYFQSSIKLERLIFGEMLQIIVWCDRTLASVCKGRTVSMNSMYDYWK